MWASQNYPCQADGGGVYSQSSTTSIFGCSFTSNSAALSGDAVFSTTSTTNVSNTYFNSTDGNQVEDGTMYAVSCSSACPAGEYGVCVADGNCWSCKLNQCLKCPIGKYSKEAGAASESECLSCDLGKFNNQSAASTCSVCGPGHYASDVSGGGVPSMATACFECPAGKYHDGTGYLCNSCAAGKSSSEASINCTDCSGGKYSPSTGSSECSTCESGKIPSAYVAAEDCEKCTSPQSSMQGSINCTICREGYYMEGGNCHVCLSNAECPLGTNISNIKVDSGYWRVSSDSSRILECISNPSACIGGKSSSSYCQDKSHGPLCAICKHNYWRSSENENCQPCDGDRFRGVGARFWVMLSLVVSILVLVCIQMIRKYNSGQFVKQMMDIRQVYLNIKTKLKISLVFTQVVSSFPSQFDVPYPLSFKKLSEQVMALMSLQIYELFPTYCFVDHRTDLYLQQLLFQTLAPLVVIGLAGLCYIIRRWFCRLPEKKINSMNETFMFWLLIFTYVVFVPCSTVVMNVFNCHYLGSGMSFMFVDYTTKCDAPVHDLMKIYAVIFIFVYPVGIPAMYFALLYRKRHAIDPILPDTKKKARMAVNPDDVETVVAIRLQNHELQPLAFLFDSYEPEFWFWEVLVCVERLLLTSSHIYLSSNKLLQPFIVLVIALVSVKLYSALDPYILDSDDLFAEIAQWFTTAVIIMTLIFQVNAVSGSSGIGILMNTMMMFVVGILVYYCLTTLKTETSFLAQMFPRTTKAGTALVASIKATLVWVLSSSDFEPETVTESTSEYRAGEQANINRQGAGFEMTSHESDEALEREIQTFHVNISENENEPCYLTSGDESLVLRRI